MSAPSISVIESIKSPSEGKTTSPMRAKRERNMSLPCVNIVEAIKILATNNELTSAGKYKYLTSRISETGSQNDSNKKAKKRNKKTLISVSSVDVDLLPMTFVDRASSNGNNQKNENKSRRSSLPPTMECFLEKDEPELEEKFEFSLKQSTVLYAIFLLNALTSGVLDMVVQIVNIQYNQCKRDGPCDTADNIGKMTVLETLMQVEQLMGYLLLLDRVDLGGRDQLGLHGNFVLEHRCLCRLCHQHEEEQRGRLVCDISQVSIP